jgi:hypothetical protein
MTSTFLINAIVSSSLAGVFYFILFKACGASSRRSFALVTLMIVIMLAFDIIARQHVIQ